MDEIRICNNDYYQRQNSENDSRAAFITQANSLFNQARYAATLEQVKAFLVKHTPELFDLDMVSGSSIRGQHYAGIQGINIDDIRGTLGRISDFDHHFQPLDDRSRDRWKSIALARMMNIPLRPIELIKVRDFYFVKDGHHRISVARALGETFIDAEVVVWDVAGILPWEKSNTIRELFHAV